MLGHVSQEFQLLPSDGRDLLIRDSDNIPNLLDYFRYKIEHSEVRLIGSIISLKIFTLSSSNPVLFISNDYPTGRNTPITNVGWI